MSGNQNIGILQNLDIASTGNVGARVASNAQLMVGAKVLGVVIGFGTLILAARGLSKTDLGIVLFLHGYMLFFAEVATFQSWQTLIRYGSDDVREKNVGGLTKLIRFCFALDFISAVAAFFAAIGLFSVMAYSIAHIPALADNPNKLDVSQISPYIYAYCVLIFASQQGVSTGILRLFDKFNVLAVRTLIMPTLRFTGTAIAFIVGSGIEGYLIAWFISSLLGKLTLPLLAYLELKSRHLTRDLFTAWPELKLTRDGLWSFVWKTNIDSTLAAGTTHLPLVLVGPLFGSAYVAIYKIAEEVANLFSRGILLLDQVIYPEFARMVSRGEYQNIWKIVVKSSAILLGGGLTLSLLIATVGRGFIAATCGPGYEQVVQLSILLVLAAAITGVVAPIYPVFYAVNRPGLAIRARLVGLIAYLASFIIFYRWLGFFGPGWAAIFGNLMSVGLAVFFVKSILTKQPVSIST